MDNSLIPKVQEAYVLALAFPANERQPLLWWEVANLYVGFGSYDGAMVIFNRLCVDFADYDKITSVLMARAATLRRRKYDDAKPCFASPRLRPAAHRSTAACSRAIVLS